jgi:signal peptidase I
VSEKIEKKQNTFLKRIMIVIAALLLFWMIVRTVLFSLFSIPSVSMMPTLLVGDYIFVNKFAYGYSKYSLPFSSNLFSGRILEFNAPNRGDVVVFRLPRNPAVTYVGRLVGLPGDRIQMKAGVLFINDQPVQKQPDGVVDFNDVFGSHTDVLVFREWLDNGVSYQVLDQIKDSRGDNTPEFVVPQGQYFMMGDHRDNSNDSRFDVGYVPAENLVGRVSVIFFSLNKDEPLDSDSETPDYVRWDRLFKVVE